MSFFGLFYFRWMAHHQHIPLLNEPTDVDTENSEQSISLKYKDPKENGEYLRF